MVKMLKLTTTTSIDHMNFVFLTFQSSDSLQLYSFVLTSSDSKWRFGFCRHDPRSGTAMVLITYLPWHDTFIRFMNVLGELKRTESDEFQPFLSEAYNRGVPEPGASLKLFYNNGTNVRIATFVSVSIVIDGISFFRTLCSNDRRNFSYQVFRKITT